MVGACRLPATSPTSGRSWGHRPLLLPGVSGVVVGRDDYPKGREQVLLVRRADTGRWSVPAGIVEPGEQPADCITRELWEETRVRVRPERLALLADRSGDQLSQRGPLPVHRHDVPLRVRIRRGHGRRRGVHRGGLVRRRRATTRPERPRAAPDHQLPAVSRGRAGSSSIPSTRRPLSRGQGSRTPGVTNGGLVTTNGSAAADVDRRPVVLDLPGVEEGQRDPVFRVGEKVPEVTDADSAPSPVEDRHAGPRDAPADGRSPRSIRAGPASFSARSAASPKKSSFFQPTAQPAGPGPG